MADLAEKHEAGVVANAAAKEKDAAESPSSSSIAEAAGINEKWLLRKLDYRLLPPLTLLYLLSFLDRSNGVYTNSLAFLSFCLRGITC